jgi:hypothetical protein
MMPTRIERMRRNPIIHGPQPPRRVFVLTEDVPTVGEHAGARAYIGRLREVYGDGEIHMEILDWPPTPGMTSQRVEIRRLEP